MAGALIEENETLIASTKVEGAAVYGAEGERLGSIYHLMVDKMSGRIEYAVLKSGGLLGMGADYYSIPWTALAYDENRQAYVAKTSKEVLTKALTDGEISSFTSDCSGQTDEPCVFEYEEVEDFEQIATV